MPAMDDPIGRYVGDPWEHQPNEPALEFARFLEFAERKPRERNLSALDAFHWSIRLSWRILLLRFAVIGADTSVPEYSCTARSRGSTLPSHRR